MGTEDYRKLLIDAIAAEKPAGVDFRAHDDPNVRESEESLELAARSGVVYVGTHARDLVLASDPRELEPIAQALATKIRQRKALPAVIAGLGGLSARFEHALLDSEIPEQEARVEDIRGRPRFELLLGETSALAQMPGAGRTHDARRLALHEGALSAEVERRSDLSTFEALLFVRGALRCIADRELAPTPKTVVYRPINPEVMIVSLAV